MCMFFFGGVRGIGSGFADCGFSFFSPKFEFPKLRA